MKKVLVEATFTIMIDVVNSEPERVNGLLNTSSHCASNEIAILVEQAERIDPCFFSEFKFIREATTEDITFYGKTD